MNRIALTLAALVVMGCSSQSGPPSHPPKVSLLAHDNTGRWQPQAVPAAEADVLHAIVASPPDEVLSMPLPLEAIYMVEIGGTRYALEPNELIQGNTQRWKSAGIQKRILNAVNKK